MNMSVRERQFAERNRADLNSFLKLFNPDEYLRSVTDIDLAALKRRGIKALLIDLDNTLVPWKSNVIYPKVAEWVQKAHHLGLKMCIVSNAGSRKRIQRLAKEFGIDYAKGPWKPRSGGFRSAMKLLGVGPKQSVVIGDQIFTDILGGNRLGLYTILVRPMHWREFAGTKISRLFELILLNIFKTNEPCNPKTDRRGTIDADRPSDENGGSI